MPPESVPESKKTLGDISIGQILGTLIIALLLGSYGYTYKTRNSIEEKLTAIQYEVTQNLNDIKDQIHKDRLNDLTDIRKELNGMANSLGKIEGILQMFTTVVN